MYFGLTRFVNYEGEQYNSGLLWTKRGGALPLIQVTRTQRDADYFDACIGPFGPTPDELGLPLVGGKLAQLVEGGGKRRIIGIGNYVNQRGVALDFTIGLWMCYGPFQWMVPSIRQGL